jgi:hypothetical protein
MNSIILGLAFTIIGITTSISGTSQVSLGNPDPILININGIDFQVDNTGQVPTDDKTIGKFINNVYIAHNFLAGKYFDNNVEITYANGSILEYEEVETIILQAIDPYSPSTNYTDGIHIYKPDDIHHYVFSKGIVFLTCYDKDGQPAWGRKFIIMKPVKD